MLQNQYLWAFLENLIQKCCLFSTAIYRGVAISYANHQIESLKSQTCRKNKTAKIKDMNS